jgi:parallel beta-helix repeat protein
MAEPRPESGLLQRFSTLFRKGTKMKKTILLVLVLALGLTTEGHALPATITVGQDVGYDCGTVQAGIDAAMDGDTVLVAPGEYVITEPITFRGKAITVHSEAGPDDTTIRMATPVDTNRGSVVVFENNETSESVLDGFTITGGKGILVPSENARAGGGIFFSASSGKLNNCVIVGNEARDVGGGVVVASGSSMTLTNCTIRGNSCTASVSAGGGGICCIQSSSLTMIGCTVAGNSAGHVGGGVFTWDGSSTTLINCRRELGSTWRRRYNLLWQVIGDANRVYY